MTKCTNLDFGQDAYILEGAAPGPFAPCTTLLRLAMSSSGLLRPATEQHNF